MKNTLLQKEAYANMPTMLSFPLPGRLEIGMSRMCVLDIIGGFLSITEGLKNEIGVRGKDVLYNAGFEGGRSFADKLIEAKKLTSDESGLKEALSQYSSAGFGTYSILDCNFESGLVNIIGNDCFEAWAHKEKKLLDNDQVCDYTRGVLAGFVSAICNFHNPVLAKEIYCVEATCSIKNNKICSFIVGPLSKLVESGIKKPKQTQTLKNQLKLKSTSLEKTLKRLKAIEEISYVCSSLFTSDLSTVSNKVLQPFCELTGADYGAVLLMKNPEKQICLNASYGLPKNFLDTYNNKLKFTIDSEDVNENWPSIRSISKKQIVLVKDTSQMSVGFSKFFSDTIKPHKIRSVASVPIVINEKAVGAVTKYYIKPHEFSDEEISFMKTTANIITSTIERNQLLEIAKKSEMELAQANEVLKTVNHELDSFVYISSHDLREPLRTIESFVGIVQDQLQGKLTSDQDDYFQRIVKSTKRMRRLIEDLTVLSRASRDMKDKEDDVISLNEALQEVQFELTAFLDRNKARITIIDKLPPVKGSKEKILSVLKNLITNGIKFNKSKNPEVKISLAEDLNFDPSKVCICIEDNGIGISKDYHEKIFGLFQRLHIQEEYEGTGAGLAIVKKILEKYNCDIWIDSKEGKGSKFYLTLLRTDE